MDFLSRSASMASTFSRPDAETTVEVSNALDGAISVYSHGLGVVTLNVVRLTA